MPASEEIYKYIYSNIHALIENWSKCLNRTVIVVPVYFDSIHKYTIIKQSAIGSGLFMQTFI